MLSTLFLTAVSANTCQEKDLNCQEQAEENRSNKYTKPNPNAAQTERKMPSPIILNSTPADSPQALVVFLHGLGDTGEGWSMAFKQPNLRNSKIKYIFPTADQMPVTLNAGFRMNSWFDLYSLSPNTEEDTEGIKKAHDKLTTLIDEHLAQHPNLSYKNVILGGFSQGGALAFYTAFNRITIANNAENPENNLYGGVFGLSTWLPLRDHFLKDENKILKEMKNTKVFQGHGDEDAVVPFPFGQLTSKIIKQSSLESQFKSYRGMQHSSCEEEMGDVKVFIEQFV